MRVFVCLLFLCCVTAASAEEERFRFGGQVSGNSYRLDDPDGSTARGGGMSLGAVAIYDMGRNSRFFLDGSRESYKLTATSSNIGQEVVNIGGSVSFQKMWRLSRDIKPWFGAGLGYMSSSYSQRYTLTPSGLYRVPLADRESSELFWVLNSNIEWQVDSSLDAGLQVQLSNSLNTNSNSLRFGVYVVY